MREIFVLINRKDDFMKKNKKLVAGLITLTIATGTYVMTGCDKPDNEQQEETVYNVKYVLNGGINDSSNPTSYKSSDSMVSLKDATRVGYEFLGWYEDSEFKKQITTIEKGDNLYSIARRYNINPDLLAILNGLNSDDYIYPNQQILIPKSNYSYYVTKQGDTLYVTSNNPAYKEEVYRPDNSESEIRVIGKVVWNGNKESA